MNDNQFTETSTISDRNNRGPKNVKKKCYPKDGSIFSQ